MTGLTAEELLALGRDREAVETALTTIGGRRMDSAQQLTELMPVLAELVDGLRPDDLSRATPCAGFDVTGVLEHMIGGASAFAPGFRGAEAGPVLEGDVVTRWRSAMAELLGAVTSDGALDRTLVTPFGELSGAAFGQYVVFDGLVHGWDISTAVDRPYAPPSDVVAAVSAALPSLVPEPARDGDTFASAQPVPPGATALEQVVAFSGRKV